MNKNTPLRRVFEGYEEQIPLAFREQFLATPEQDYDVVLEGIMHKIWHHPTWLKPLFKVLGVFGILVPRTGQNIPTKLVVVPGYLSNGEPYHEWNRVFAFDPEIKFDTTIVFDQKFENIADQVGVGRFLHMVWDGQFIPPRSFTLDTIANGIRLGEHIWYLPKWVWSFFLGRVKFIQSAHEDEEDVVDVKLRIVHPVFGEVFGYEGTFRAIRYPKSL